MKRTISAILAVFMLLTLMPMSIMADDEIAFSDVKSTDYYAEAAQALAVSDILEGYPDGTFGALRAVTRAEMAAIVCRMIGKETEAVDIKSVFTDVDDNHWAIAYIATASEEKIINGDGDGTFRPEDDVLFEEAIKMVVCALGMVDDIEIDPADWSKAYLKIADDNGITDNLAGMKGSKAIRGDIAVMVYNGIAPEAAVKAPTASVEAGTYTSSKKVTLKTETEGAKIYYTTDGKTPTAESTEYTKEITISESCTLKAIAVSDGVVSDVLSVSYTIKTSSGGSSSGSSSSGGKLDFEAEEGGSSDSTDDDGSGDSENTDNNEPTQEEIEASAKICEELQTTLDDIVLIEFEGKTAEIMVYVEKDIKLALEEAESGTLITNEYVRETYKEDIDAVKEIIDSMTDEEKAEFKQELMKMNTYSLLALKKYFNINTSYLD